jgi:hypothetical protein
MKSRGKRRFRPGLEGIEDRCLLSLAVVEIQNKSTYTITFNFRWTDSSSWTSYTEAPGQGEILWTSYSSFLTPEASYNTTTWSGSATTVTLAQGYGQWDGGNPPPASSATLYQFQNTGDGVELYYAAPPTPTVAVAEILNDSMYTITFGFRWTASSSWSYYTEGPGQGEIFWTTYSDSLTPQALYDTTTWSGSQTTVSMVQGYGEWTGTGTPPTSSAKLYEFQNDPGGVQLYYGAGAPSQPPGPAPAAISSPNWSGYVAASNLNNPQAGSVTAVSGTWNVPAVSGPSVGIFDSSTWVGIDGFDGGTVEQLGTEQDLVNGVPVYRAWWEMFSSGWQQPEQIITGMTIMPGDSISASVQYITSGAHAGQFDLTITDNSRPFDSFSTYQSSPGTQSPLAQRSTAEWIMEAPSVGGQIAQMPNFSTVTFTSATAVIDGIPGPINSPAWQSASLDLAANGVRLDTTSVLTGSGQGFSVSSNYGVNAGAIVSPGLTTAQAQVGSYNPQVIVVGQQWPTPGSGPTHLAVSGQPASVTSGASFGLQVLVEDASGNVAAGYDGAITLVVASGPGGAALGGRVTVNALNGIVNFSGLDLGPAGTYTLQATASGLSSASFNLVVTASSSGSGSQTGSGSGSGSLSPQELAWIESLVGPGSSPPAVTSVSPLEPGAVTGAHRHGKGAGKSLGFTLHFNRALNPASASNPGNYQIVQSVRHGRRTIPQAVPFRVIYDPAAQAVDLVLLGKPKFTAGGTLTVLDSNLDASGVRGVGQTSYTILPHGRGLSG